MKVKMLVALMLILALSLALLPQLRKNSERTSSGHMPEEDWESSSEEDRLDERPVMVAAKRLMKKPGKADPLESSSHVPLELDSWLSGLRRDLLAKGEAQIRRNMLKKEAVQFATENPIRQSRVKSTPGEQEVPQDEADPEDSPFLLWRELQLRGDNSLVVSMLLVNNRREGQSKAVIVSQIIPKGWSLSAAWPDIQAENPKNREVKWLFAEAASRRNWILQVVLTPDKQTEIPRLPEENTSVRCCLPGGTLMEYACTSLL